MLTIVAPIRFAETGSVVANLQLALVFLYEHGAFKWFDAPNQPTQDDLKALFEKLRSELSAQTFGEATQQLLRYFQIQEGLGDNLFGAVEKATAKRLNELLFEFGVVFETGGYLVKGRAIDLLGRPQPGLMVIAFDRDLRRHQKLGEAVTDASGVYNISYQISDFQAADGVAPAAADLFVLAMEIGGTEVLVTSEVVYQAKAVETIDLVVPASQNTPSEFQQITDPVMPLLVGQGEPRIETHMMAQPMSTNLSPQELNANDVEFLAKETGLDATAIFAWSEAARALSEVLKRLGDGDADQLNALREQGWPFLFSMLRQKLATDLDGILKRSDAEWIESALFGTRQNLIVEIASKYLNLMVSALRRLALMAQLDMSRTPGSILAQVITLSPSPETVALAALEINTKLGITKPEDFLELTTTFPDDKLKIYSLVRSMRLHQLTGGDMLLANILAADLKEEDHTIEPLAELSREAWEKRIQTAETQGAGARLGSELEGRALGLQTQVEQLHPLPALISRIRAGSLMFQDPELTEIGQTLDQFGLTAEALLKNEKTGSGHVNGMDIKHVEILRNLGRFNRTGLTMDVAADLINAGISTPAISISYGRDVVISILKDKYPKHFIDSYWGHTHGLYQGGKGFLGDVIITARPPLMMGGGSTVLPPQVRENLPTVRGFFGDLDECSCLPCESVLGLPAYLVDLLNLLKTSPLQPGSSVPHVGSPATAQSVLRYRRSDIFDMPLSCLNAEEEVLHIDLAVKVLERGLTRLIGGSATADAALASSVYPWTLPFDPKAAEANACFSKLGLSSNLIHSLLAISDETKKAAPTLGIGLPQASATTSEWSLITMARSGASLWEAYGFSLASGQTNVTLTDPSSGVVRTGPPASVLSWVSVLTAKTGLDLNELRDALATRFVGERLLSGTDQCKPSLMQVVSASEATFDRLHRFVRLLRKMPSWSIPLLDSLILACQTPGTATGATQINDEVLKALAAAERARVKLSLSPEDVLGMRMLMSDVRLQFNPNVNLLQRTFDWRVAVGSSTLVQVMDQVAASIGADSRELSQLIAGTSSPNAYQVTDNLSENNLVWLYRQVRLSQSFGLTVRQSIQLQLITGIAPFEVPSANLSARIGFQRLTDLYEAARLLQSMDLEIEFVAALLVPANSSINPVSNLDATTTKLSQTVGELKLALREEPNAPSGTPEQKADQYLSRLLGQPAAGHVLRALRGVTTDSPIDLTDVSGALDYLCSVPADPSSPSTSARLWGEQLPLFTTVEATTLMEVDSNRTLPDRLNVILTRVASRLRERRLITFLSSKAGLNEATVTRLLTGGLEWDPVPGSAAPRLASDVLLAGTFWQSATPPDLTTRPDLYDWLHRLDRLSTLQRHLQPILSVVDLSQGFQVSDANGQLLDLNWRLVLAPCVAPSWSSNWLAFQELLYLSWLGRPENVSAKVLGEHLQKVKSVVTVGEAAVQPIAIRLGISSSELLSITSNLASTVTPDSLLRPSLLRRIYLLATHLKPSATTALQLNVMLDLGNTAIAARTARALLQAQLGESASAAIAKIDDHLRTMHRDALVACLLNKHQFGSPNDLYEHYLIDSLVQPCLKTTRVLQAAASVQLFIQRILHGIEKDLTQGTELKRRWSWMRNYRVWEANRKVFLYPENWLYPELRDDKSSCFRVLESALGQEELNGAVAQQSFLRFLDDVANVGQTQVLGMFEEKVQANTSGARGSRSDLYVVGRSANPPYAYLWRRCNDFGGVGMEWTPWQRIELDIQGDHVIPFVLGAQLFLAWPKIEKQKGVATGNPDKWNILLAWSSFNGRQWSPISISRDSPDQQRLFDVVAFSGDERGAFSFRYFSEASGEVASIRVFAMAPNLNTMSQKDPVVEIPPKPIARPSSLYQISKTATIASLIATNYLKLDVKYQELVEAYLTRKSAILNQQHRADLPGLFYPNLDVFGDPDAYTKHAAEVAAWPHIAALVPGISEQVAILPEFVSQFLQYAYSRSRSSLYQDFVNSVISNSHIRRVHFRVWARVNFQGVPDLVKLGPENGQFTLDIGSSSRILQPEVEAVFDWRMGNGDPINCSMRWSATGSLPSGTQQLPAITIGNEAEQWLHFEIDGRQVTNLGLMGIELKRDMREVAKFSIGRAPAVRSELGNNQLLQSPLRDVDPWMNGFRELRSNTHVVALQPGQQPLQIFDGSNWRDKYWVVGAASSGVVNFPEILHYSNGDASCYIDLRARSNPSKLPLYPDSGATAKSVLVTMSLTQVLPEGFNQVDTGGFESLPVGSTSFSSQLPTNIRNGQRAFDGHLPNACYNWEIYFHAPLLIADQLSKQQRFEEAERWLRFVFDPTSGESGSDARRFMRFRVFKELDVANSAIRQLTLLAKAAGQTATSDEVEEIRLLIEQWRTLPFRPFLIARRRHVAFLWRTLFSYLDNLIAWADSLYRRDTRESIGEATLLYVLASRILGAKPKVYSGKSMRSSPTYDGIAGSWDDFANLWIDTSQPARYQAGRHAGLLWSEESEDTGNEGYLQFCIPFNDKLFTYWNTVELRLFNIRHCRNIEGTSRELALTDPPIDPELLVRATAAGLDIGDVIAGLYSPPPTYRFVTLASRASELANDAKALGNALLSALEKRDSEQMAILRSTNEVALLQRITVLRELQIAETEQNIAALRATRAMTVAKFEQYQRLLGRKDTKAPEEHSLIGEEPMLGRAADSAASEASNLGLLDQENKQIEYLSIANTWGTAAGIMKGVAGASHMSASIVLAATAGTGTVAAEVLRAIGTGVSTTAEMSELISRGWQNGANHESLMASHLRRRDEWAFQSNLTLKELRQIDQQLLANQIRVELARKERENQLVQIEQAQAVDAYLRDKYTNAQLYDWMVSQLSTVHWSTYQMALDLARRAERASQRELGARPINLIRNDYWNSLRSGLLAGDRLHQDIKRLEISHLDQNRREHELIKHVSLSRLNPVELNKLKTTGVCDVKIPEWLFDMDMPGHYMRRIKTVSVSIPCVVGPYASVNCKLTLLKNVIRHSPSSDGTYPMRSMGDADRFSVNFGASESIVTSTGRDDSGLFETALRDERYLPFESAGAISDWRVEIPGKPHQFDFDTISDVILHVRYTARDGGEDLRDAALEQFAAQSPSRRTSFPQFLLSTRSDFGNDWATAQAGNTRLKVKLSLDLLPYWMQALGLVIRGISIIPWAKDGTENPQPTTVWSAVPPLSQPGIDGNGVGVADLGPIGTGVDDILILLDVGRV